MARKKKTITIKIERKPVALGHQSHISGSGAHQDKRTKRVRTRQAKRQQWRKEWG